MNKNITKVLITVLLTLFITGCSIKDFEIKTKEFEYKRPVVSEQLLFAVKDIVNLMSSNNIKSINDKYIHPIKGFYDLHKIDTEESFIKNFRIEKFNIDDSNEFYDAITRLELDKSSLVINQSDIIFDCSPNNDAHYGWNKEGIYLNTDTQKLLSKLMLLENDRTQNKELKKYTKDDLHDSYLIERTSYKVVITPEIVFYLTKFDNKWYISLVDRITTDCAIKKNKKDNIK